MTTDFDDDLATMFEDLPSVTVVFGAVTAQAFQDTWDGDALPGVQSRGVVASQVALSFPTTRFPGLAMGSALTVEGVAYTVIDSRRPLDDVDGAITHLLLQKV